MKNFTSAKSTVMPITLMNAQYLRTDYSARNKNELPVMTRWFELPPMIEMGVAKNLSIVLYSRYQLIKECLSKGTQSEKNLSEDSDFINDLESVVSIISYPSIKPY